VAPKTDKLQPILLTGDAVTIFVTIFIGLRFHESNELLAGRLIVNVLPFLLAWFLAASALDLFRPPKSIQWTGFVQLLKAATFAAPLGAVLRGFALNRPIVPLFALVMVLALLAGLLVWRATYIAVVAPQLKSK
jgi:hypothetical protein